MPEHNEPLFSSCLYKSGTLVIGSPSGEHDHDVVMLYRLRAILTICLTRSTLLDMDNTQIEALTCKTWEVVNAEVCKTLLETPDCGF